MSTANDGHKLIEIDGRNPINCVAFLRDEKRIVSGGDEGSLQYWDVQDGQEAGSVASGGGVLTVAVSKDGKCIVTGAKNGLVTVWDTKTQRKLVDIRAHSYWVIAVEVSPDSKKVGTASYDGAAFIWDITTGQLLVGPFQPRSGPLVALKFSATGTRVAISTYGKSSVRIHDTQSQDGALLVDLPIQLSSDGNEPTTPLAWSIDDRQLFAISHDGNIQCFDASSGSLLSQWPIHSKSNPASIVLSNSGKFIAASAGSSVSFWDASTHSQLGPVVEHTGLIQSISFSSDDSCLVSGGRSGKKVTVWNLRDVLPESNRRVTAGARTRKLGVALLDLSCSVYVLWKQGDWNGAERVIAEEMTHSSHPSHDSLANRAFVRAHLQDWNNAYEDAQQSLKIQLSIVGYIAKAMACVGQGESQAGIRTFDLSFMHCSLEEIPYLFLIRCIILFEIGERDDAVGRVHDLIDTVDDKSIFYAVQAQMFLLLGNRFLKEGDYESAIKLFKRAQLRSLPLTSPHLKTISLIFGWKFDGLDLAIRRQLCEALHTTSQMKESAKALLETISILDENIQTNKEAANWINEFTRRCVAAFESMADTAIHSQAYDKAIEQYSVALSLNPASPHGLYLKRSKALAIKCLWEDAISDADEAIKLDLACPWGYERKQVALHGARRFDEAVDAFCSMLSAIENSADEGIRQRRDNYVSPSTTMIAIDAAIHEIFKICPFVLIDIKTGLLCDGPERTGIFKADPTFKELISSMTEKLDESRILQVVSGYFRYVMFSHAWEGNEPTFQEVNVVKSVWVLPSSPLNDKLRKFCEMARDDGYRWAWSDTCCINKSTSTLLSRSLVSMYQWYEEAAVTLALLVGVPSPSFPGDLTNSLWMMRAWTLLELLASKVIRFYDSDWRPYLNDTHANHKESHMIVQELADALGVTPEIITNFHPGALGVREVLRLASTRAATVEEDMAYSLIGIVASDITPNYGEGEAALGHLLEEALTRSGETSVLAWTGKSSGFNSCFPASMVAYKQSLFIPPRMNEDEIEKRVSAMRSTVSQQEATTIYDRITRLPSVIGAHRRLHLPCIVFPVKHLRRHRGNRYRAQTSVLGEVEFQASRTISLTEPRKLCFVHPWIRGLLDQGEMHAGLAWEDGSETDITCDSASDIDFNAAVDIDPNTISEIGATLTIISAESDTDIVRSRSLTLPSWSSVASRMTRLDDYTRALRLLVRIEQPFSALLLQQVSDGQFRRVAAKHEIIVRPRQITCSKDVQTAVLQVL